LGRKKSAKKLLLKCENVGEIDTRGQFHQHLCATFSLANFDAFFGKWHLANGAQIRQILGHKLGDFGFTVWAELW
jgi:hypothetical protein